MNCANDGVLDGAGVLEDESVSAVRQPWLDKLVTGKEGNNKNVKKGIKLWTEEEDQIILSHAKTVWVVQRRWTKDDLMKVVDELEGRTLQAVQVRWYQKLKRSFIASIDGGGGGDEKNVNEDAVDEDATEEDGSGPCASPTKKGGNAAAAASKKKQNKRRRRKTPNKKREYTMKVDEDMDEYVIEDHSCLDSCLFKNDRIIVRDESIGGRNVPVYATFVGDLKFNDCTGEVVCYLVKIKGSKTRKWIPKRAIQSILLPKDYDLTGERDGGGGGDKVKGENEGEGASPAEGAKRQRDDDHDYERKGCCLQDNRNISMEDDAAAPARVSLPSLLHHFPSNPSEDQPAPRRSVIAAAKSNKEFSIGKEPCTPAAASFRETAAANNGGRESERCSSISLVIAIDDENIEGREREGVNRNRFQPVVRCGRNRPIKEVEEDDAAAALEHRSSSPSPPSLSIKKSKLHHGGISREHTSTEHCSPIIALNDDNDAGGIGDDHDEYSDGGGDDVNGSANDGGDDAFTHSNSIAFVKRRGEDDAGANDTDANDTRPLRSRDGGWNCRVNEEQKAAAAALTTLPPAMTTTCHHTLPSPPTPPPSSFLNENSDKRRRSTDGGQKVAVAPNAATARVRTPSPKENGPSENGHVETAENNAPSSHARTAVAVTEEAVEEGDGDTGTRTTFVYDLTDEQDSTVTPRCGNTDLREPLVPALLAPASPVHRSKSFRSGGGNGAKRQRLGSPLSSTSSDSADVIVIDDMDGTTAAKGHGVLRRGKEREAGGVICSNDGGNSSNNADGSRTSYGGGGSIKDDGNNGGDGRKNDGIVISSDSKEATAGDSVHLLAHEHRRNNSCDLFRRCIVACSEEETNQGGQRCDEGMCQRHLQAYARMQQQRMPESSHLDHTSDSDKDGHGGSRNSGARASAVQSAQVECRFLGIVETCQPAFYDLTADDPMKVKIKEERNVQTAPVENIAEDVESSSPVARLGTNGKRSAGDRWNTASNHGSACANASSAAMGKGSLQIMREEGGNKPHGYDPTRDSNRQEGGKKEKCGYRQVDANPQRGVGERLWSYQEQYEGAKRMYLKACEENDKRDQEFYRCVMDGLVKMMTSGVY